MRIEASFTAVSQCNHELLYHLSPAGATATLVTPCPICAEIARLRSDKERLEKALRTITESAKYDGGTVFVVSTAAIEQAEDALNGVAAEGKFGWVSIYPAPNSYMGLVCGVTDAYVSKEQCEKATNSYQRIAVIRIEWKENSVKDEKQSASCCRYRANGGDKNAVCNPRTGLNDGPPNSIIHKREKFTCNTPSVETAWLIELSHPQDAPMWLSVEFGVIVWTRNTNAVMRFFDRASAEQLISAHLLFGKTEGSTIIATEHQWG